VTETVPNEITHLDFDPEQEPKCAGYKLRHDNGEIGGNNFTCPRTPILVTVRACCGMVAHYCADCYNAVCKFHAERGWDAMHGKHYIKGKPFSQVQFL
jgi:hypothetical protein